MEQTYRKQSDNDFDWTLLANPSEWYLTPNMMKENMMTLLIGLGTVLFYCIFFLIAKSRGDSSQWYKSLKFAKRLKMSDSLITKIWLILYFPLGLSSWLVWFYGGQKWNRGLTVFSLHIVVNLIFPVSFYWVKDLSLALLNLIILLIVAMFTMSQFGNTLQFASFINTPYLLFLFIYIIQFCYFWYLNEGKELLDLTKNISKGGGSILSAFDSKKTEKKRKVPSKIRKRLMENVKKQQEEVEKFNKQKELDEIKRKKKEQEKLNRLKRKESGEVSESEEEEDKKEI